MATQITLPRDAEGREIPLNTKVLYENDGDELCVKRIEFDAFDGLWRFADAQPCGRDRDERLRPDGG